ncbi:MAG: hypothetical protein KatS3mg003_0505 [Candidatus Nitrosocaldaceae archaeon]|nr:MAG: hypothetical protein KatS3mg003_0505 [Candidatus Nitrosocaldaceae archaeon]
MPCAICGARFSEHTCVYCNNKVCSGCIDNDARKCIRCKELNSMPTNRFLKRNWYLFLFIGLAWIFVIFPYPFLINYGYAFNYATLLPIIIASVAMIIPLIFLFKSWKKRGY